MAFLSGILFFYLLFWLSSVLNISHVFDDVTARGAAAIACMFILIGILHFVKPDKFEQIIPANWPYRSTMNYVSGAAEIIFGIGLLFAQTRVYAAYGLIALLIAVFPANIYAASEKPDFYNIFRLFFQPMYIYWLYWFCLRK